MKLRERRHQAAVKAINAYHHEGTPFVLLLRTYGKKIDASVNFQNVFSSMVERGVGIVSVRGREDLATAEEAEDDPALKPTCPALIIDDASWQERVVDCIETASVIIFELWEDTPGVSFELETCQRLGREDDTLVVLPRPQIDALHEYSLFEGFWRFVLYDDLNKRDLQQHPALRGIGIKPTTPYMIARNGVPIVTPEIIEIADEYFADGDLASASVHYQTAWNIQVMLAEQNSPVSEQEMDTCVSSAIGLAARHKQLGTTQKGTDLLYAAAVIAKACGLHERISDIQQAKVALTA